MNGELFVVLGFFLITSQIPFFFHIKVYKTLLTSIELREGPVWTRRDYPGLRITSLALAMPHIKKVQKRFHDSLTQFEISQISKARMLYYFGSFSSILVFLVMVINVLFEHEI